MRVSGGRQVAQTLFHWRWVFGGTLSQGFIRLSARRSRIFAYRGPFEGGYALRGCLTGSIVLAPGFFQFLVEQQQRMTKFRRINR